MSYSKKEWEEYYLKNKQRILDNKRESTKDWFKRNPEKVKLYRKRYKINNPEKYKNSNREAQKKWLINHRELSRKKSSEYQKKNKNKVNRYQREYYKRRTDKQMDVKRIKDTKRRVLKMGLGGSFTFDEWINLKKQYNYICPSCKLKEPFLNQVYKCLTEDHKIPISKWNEWIKLHPEIKYECNDIENIQPLCHSCNCSKKDRIDNLEKCNK